METTPAVLTPSAVVEHLTRAVREDLIDIRISDEFVEQMRELNAEIARQVRRHREVPHFPDWTPA